MVTYVYDYPNGGPARFYIGRDRHQSRKNSSNLCGASAVKRVDSE
jgi:hypothetical protein